jgi:hypothetical protein
MLEYHERNKKGGPVKTPKADAVDLGTGNMEKYMQIASQYGIPDIDDFEFRENEQTHEQEYQAYITAACLSKTVNVLKFWKVGDFVNGISVVLIRHCRLTERPSPLFLRWR